MSAFTKRTKTVLSLVFLIPSHYFRLVGRMETRQDFTLHPKQTNKQTLQFIRSPRLANQNKA